LPASRARYAFLPLLALLAACDNAASLDDDAGRAASGEVLEGSISDDMLPLESVNSQPPTADPLPGESVPAPADDAAGPADPAEDEPAAEPTEEPAEPAETP